MSERSCFGALSLILVSVGVYGVTGVAPDDPITFAGASLILSLLALLAAYVPSRRAARLNPVETLRCE